MSLDGFDVKSLEEEVVCFDGVVEGAATAISMWKGGRGITVSRTGAGAYLLTWTENPGAFLSCLMSIGAATPGDVAGHTVIWDEFDTSALTQAFIVYDAADAAHDLAADEYVSFCVKFQRTSQ